MHRPTIALRVLASHRTVRATTVALAMLAAGRGALAQGRLSA
jgi:hypothetical protein